MICPGCAAELKREDGAYCAKCMREALKAAANNVIQLNPEYSHGWGPLLCIVEEVMDWGVKCYALVPEKRWETPGLMYMHVEHGHYAIIGQVEWRVAKSDD